MPINNTLMNAILSMDSYNRGYGAGIQLDVDANGESINQSLGKAIITFESDIQEGSEGFNAGFYGIAYDIKDNQGNVIDTVISYRGTSFDDGGSDVLNGWPLGGGFTNTSQGEMAIEFFQSVAGAGSYFNADISLTGHSLGGGLAGYVGQIYHQNALVFDSMDFEAAAENTYQESIDYKIDLRNLITLQDSLGVRVTQAQLDSYLSDPNYDVLSQEVYNSNLKNLIYGNDTPQELSDLANISGHRISGEFLGLTPWSPSSGVENHGLGLNVSIISDVGTLERHDMALMTMRYFAEVGGNNNTSLATDWEHSAQYFWPVTFDDSFASQIGFATNSDVAGQYQTDGKYSQILRQTLAYSAIDDGVTPFGDTGIRAFYHDANVLGEALQAQNVSSVLLDDKNIENISKSFIQFAGTLALNKVEQDDFGTAINGIFDYLDTDNILSINFSDARWQEAGINSLPPMIARASLVGDLLEETGIENDIRDSMENLWGDRSTNVIQRAAFVVSDNVGSSHVADATYAGPTLVIAKQTGGNISTGDNDYFLLGQDGTDSLTGGAGDDILFGGNGNDILQGKGGKDVLYGGNNDDTFFGFGTASGLEGDKFYGGKADVYGNDYQDGYDTLNYSTLNFTYGLSVRNLSSFTVRGWDDSSSQYIGLEEELGLIEHLILSNQNDRVTFYSPLSPNSIFPIDRVNALNGNDNVHFADKSFLKTDGTSDHAWIENAPDFVTLENFETYSGKVTLLTSESSAGNVNFGSIDTNGNAVDFNGIVKFDHSSAANAATFDFVTSDGDVVSISTNGVMQSVYHDNDGNREFWGSHQGDTVYDLDGTKFISGTGNDFIHVLSSGSGYAHQNASSINYIYTGGNDTIYSGRYGGVTIWEGLTRDDLSGYTYSIVDTYGVDNNNDGIDDVFYEYVDLVLNFGSHGSLTLDNFVTNNGITVAFSNDREHVVYTDTAVTSTAYTTFYETTVGNSWYSPNPYFEDETVVTLYGGNNNYAGTIGDDTIYGGAGDDIISGGTGLDEIYGGAGDDTIYGETVYGGAGSDTIEGEGAINRLYGGSGDDTLTGGADLGQTTNETIDGEYYTYSNRLDGGTGNDNFIGSNGRDLFIGRVGNNTYAGGQGDDSYITGVNSDHITDYDGLSKIVDNGGDDTYNVAFIDAVDTKGDDAYNIDIVNPFVLDPQNYSAPTSDNIYVHIEDASGTNTLNFTNFDGTSLTYGLYENAEGNLVLAGGYPSQNPNIIYNDLFQIVGVDSFSGISFDGNFYLIEELSAARTAYTPINTLGNDTYDVSQHHIRVRADLLSGDDVAFGSAFDDEIHGDEGNDTLYGNAGNDTLFGGAGDDTLIGGIGSNNLRGEDGNDTYIIAPNEYSYIYDDLGINSIQVNNLQVADLTYSLSGTNFTIFDLSSNILAKTVTQSYFDGVTFSDGRFYTFDQLHQYTIDPNSLPSFIQGTVEDDTEYFFSNTSGVSYEGGDGSDTVLGSNYGDLFYGGNDDDVLYGRAGDDRLYGGAGDDYLSASHDNDVAFGDEGNDVLYGGMGNDRLYGGVGADVLIGSDDDDNLYGGKDNERDYYNFGPGVLSNDFGHDIVHDFNISDGERLNFASVSAVTDINDLTIADAGDDALITVDANNSVLVKGIHYSNLTTSQFNFALLGTAGVDSIYGSDEWDYIYGNDQEDFLYGYGGSDTIYGGAMKDRIYGGLGKDSLYGEDGNDYIYGEEGGDSIYGGNLSDVLRGDQGDDFIYGGTGDDYIYGDDANSLAGFIGAGNDYLYGEDGNDDIYGGDGDDWIEGGEGVDTIEGNSGVDIIYGGTGYDWLYGGDGNDNLYGEDGEDQLRGNNGDDYLDGGDDKDTLYGDDGNDILDGGIGDFRDNLAGGNGDDILYGRDGDDYLYGDNDNDTLYGGTGVDNLKGNYGDDVVYGEDGWDFLEGNQGNDELYGGEGNDKLYGGDGNDLLNGGTDLDNLYGHSGNDTFAFYAGDLDGSRDYIMDWSNGNNIIDISDVINYSSANGDNILDFVQFNAGSSYTRINVDEDGSGTSSSWTAVTQIQNTTGLDIQTMIANGSLIVE
tara:strand:- start:70060 stop:76224 length:6165 start_codon:yes stop_codon:yes gene_type:complete